MKMQCFVKVYGKIPTEQANITVPIELENGITVRDLLVLIGINPENIGAVTVNDQTVECVYQLRHGDRISVLPLIIGG